MGRLRLVLVLAVAGGLAACAAPGTGPAPTQRPAAATPQPAFTQEGVASWYGPGWAGRKTASGEIFDPQKMTAAHRSLPLGTVVHVTNLENGRTATVRINDRGPHVKGDKRRIIDLSARAAATLGMKKGGVAEVRIEADTAGADAADAQPSDN